MPTIPPHLQPPAMPKKAEIIITWTDGSARHYSTDALTSISLPAGEDYVEVFDGRPVYNSEPKEFSIEGWHWECEERRPTVATKKVHQLTEGDHVKDYGKVVEIGLTSYVGNRRVVAVAFEDRPPAVLESNADVVLVPPPKVELIDLAPHSDIKLTITPSAHRSVPGDSVFLYTQSLTWGIHVSRKHLIKILQDYAPGK